MTNAWLPHLVLSLLTVGEEDEVSIADVVSMVTEAMEFKGEIKVGRHTQLYH